MRVVFLWTTLSGYMAACWRELAKRPEVDLLVIAYRSSAKSNTSFDDSLLEGIPHQLLNDDERMDGRGLIQRVVAHRPDVIVATGWWQKHFREVALAPELVNAAFIMGLDTPWRTPLQYLNRVRFPRYLRRLDGVAPAGERAWQHARNLGISPDRIFRGQYGVDVAAYRPTLAARLAKPWPRRFLFAGRFVEEKAVDVLVEAYRLYRERVTNPWALRCCGRGPLGHLLGTVPGIEDAGFVQPADMPRHWAEAGAFLIPSRFDPWPLALVEACAAGLPVIASEVCGSAVELLRPRYNGLLVPEENAEALAAAMVTLHENEACLPEWGRRSQTLAEPYSAEVWTERWVAILRQTVAARRRRRGMPEKPEAGNLKPEVGIRRSEDGGRRAEGGGRLVYRFGSVAQPSGATPDRKLQIVHVATTVDAAAGGLARAVPKLALVTAAAGAEVYLLAPETPTPTFKEDDLAGVQVLWIKDHKDMVATLTRLVLALPGPIILHNHGVWTKTNHAVARLAEKRDFPLVCSTHSMLDPWALSHKRWKKKLAWWLYARRDLRQATALHATAELEALNISNLGLGVPVSVVALGTDLPPALTAPMPAQQQRRLLFLSRLNPKKGLPELILAFAQLNPAGWELVIGGNDEEGFGEKCEQQARASVAADRIRFIGAVSDADKWALYRSADVFVLPSYSENFGLVIAEALACGVPVLTTQATPWKELETRKCGWCIPTGEAALTAALAVVCKQERVDLVEMGARGRTWIEHDYGWERAGEKMVQFYRRIQASRSSATGEIA